MPDRPRYYLTTAIAYANHKPGLHTLYEVIGADVIARWHRLKGDDTRFLTGTDEHSVNIAMRAAEEGKEPKAFVDEQVELFREAEARSGSHLTASSGRRIRTTSPRPRRWSAGPTPTATSTPARTRAGTAPTRASRPTATSRRPPVAGAVPTIPMSPSSG